MPDTRHSIYFNPGEGITDGDMNDIQNALHVVHGDYGIAGLCRNTNFVSQPATQTVYAAPGALQGCIRAHTSTSNLVTNNGGTIYLRESVGLAIDGVTPRLLTYQLSDGELDSVLTPDPSLPRWVGIFVRLEPVNGPLESRDFQDATTLAITSQNIVKTRQVRLTKLVVNGTPAASPVIPATPPQYAPIAYVNVTAGHTGVFSNSTDIVDSRFPLGLKASWIPASALIQKTGTWTYDATLGVLNTTGTGVRECAAIPALPFNARLISARFFVVASAVTGTPAIYAARHNLGLITVGTTAIGTGTGTVEGSFDTAPGTTSIDGPIWGGGRRHPMSNSTIGDYVSGGGALHSANVSSGTQSVFGCLILYAGG